jgi:hypothetical protein
MYQRLALLIFAVVLLAGQSGILVHQHFCNDTLMAQRLFVPAPPCYEIGIDGDTAPEGITDRPACPMHGGSDHDEKGCCDDRAEYESADWEAPQIVQDDLSELVPTAVSQAFLNNEPGITGVYIEPAIAPRNHAPPDYRLSPAWLQTYRC